jgi:probable rRNA maturation factor
MIEFNYETDFLLENDSLFVDWILKTIESEEKTAGEVNYIFCDDAYLLEMNIKHLQHDTLTDIITFDYTLGNLISGDIFISIERVIDNAKDFEVSFDEELKRVMVHGILHLCGYKDKSEADELLMRAKEDEKIKMFHVEHN